MAPWSPLPPSGTLVRPDARHPCCSPFHAAPTLEPDPPIEADCLLQSLWHSLCGGALRGHQAGLPAGGQLQAHHKGGLWQPCMSSGIVLSRRSYCRRTVQVSYAALLDRLHSDMTCNVIIRSTAPHPAGCQAQLAACLSTGCYPGCTSSCLATDACRLAAQRCHQNMQCRSNTTKQGTACCVVSIFCVLGLLQY